MWTNFFFWEKVIVRFIKLDTERSRLFWVVLWTTSHGVKQRITTDFYAETIMQSLSISRGHYILFYDNFYRFIFIERLCSEHAKLHHTMERLSGFSIRASRRIYFALMEKFRNTYKIETLILILHGLVIVQMITILEVIISSIFKLVSDCLFSVVIN